MLAPLGKDAEAGLTEALEESQLEMGLRLPGLSPALPPVLSPPLFSDFLWWCPSIKTKLCSSIHLIWS